jgi:ATP/maltotriose-dependent transcriptional regulator MalT/DNA-binding SARP family transcriptional activator
MEDRPTPVIRSKLAIPALPEQLVARPRLCRLVADLIDRHRIVVVSATAGAGKTTAVVSALEMLDRTVVWLAVDRTDAAAGRLVTYLEAALAERFPALAGLATGALAAGIAHAEAAGLLAEAAAAEPVVLVLDDLERLGAEREAWAVLEALLRYAPATMTIVLVSRREIPTALCVLPVGTVIAALSEEDLAFTQAEAGEALARAGKGEVDAAAAVEATGGWVTGVLFEAWRSAEHVAGGGETDPLYGYLSSHILAQIDQADREFLIVTSLLDDVSAPRAESLGLRRSGERLMALRAAHLPVSWDTEGLIMRCHSRFREYLQAGFERLDLDEARAFRLAHARQLAGEGLHEEAVEEFLRAAAAADAVPSAEAAIVRVIERGDFGVAERWLEALADAAPVGAAPLTIAELMLAVAREDLRRVVRIADQLAALGDRDRLAASSDTAVWTMTWGYISTVRPDDVHAVLAAAQPGPTTDLARYAARVLTDLEGESLRRPPLTGTPVDAFVYIADYALGNLGELVQESDSRWAEAVKGQWRIAGMRAMGHTHEALALLEAAAPSTTLSLQAWIGAEVLIDAGRAEEARAVVARGRRLARASGQSASEAMNTLAEARLALRADDDPAAAFAALDRPEHKQVASRFRFIGEVSDTWRALALLRESQDDEALPLLRCAVQGMVGGGRLLELPTAAVYLSEAEWRTGDEDGADAAADLALEAARSQGSNHVLLQALADFPAVVSRRLDAEPGVDSPWHELGRALIAQGVRLSRTVQVSVELREFGARTLLVNGDEVRPRIGKTYELLAFLATRSPPRATRTELLEALFEGRADKSARAYLRQATHWLRQLLPDGGLVVEDGRVQINDDVAMTSESIRFEAALAEAARLQGGDRLTATLAALAIFDQGEYLPGTRSNWGDRRQQELADLANDARFEAAELALAAGDHRRARALVTELLTADPFREPGWRLAMRVAETLGDEQGIMRAYHDCERSLAEVGAAPSPTTRQLLERLRR